jgi:lysophospholipase L1-like esterase
MRRNELTPTKAWIYAGLVLAGGVGAACLVSSLKKPLIKKGDRILLVGDSLSVGLRFPLSALAKESGFELKHIGKEGTAMNAWSADTGHGASLNGELSGWRPSVVLVSLGTNDEAIKKYNPSANVVTQQAPYLTRLLAKVRASGAQVLWIGPPANTFMSPELRKLIRESVGADHYFPSEKYDLQKQPDGIHPTVKGYGAWGGAIWRWLETGKAPASVAPVAPGLALAGRRR